MNVADKWRRATTQLARVARYRERASWRDHTVPDGPVEWSPEELTQHHFKHLIAKDSASLDDWKSFHKQWLADFGDLPLREHTGAVWVAWLKAREADKPPLAEMTRAKLLGLASALYGWGQEQHAIDLNPITEVPRKARPKRRVRNQLRAGQQVLGVAEIRAVLGVNGLRPELFWDHLFFSAALCLGARFAELAGLRQVDLRSEVRPLPAVIIDKQFHAKQRKFRAPKDKQTKVVPAHPALLRLIEQVPDRFLERSGRRWGPSDPLLPFFPENGVQIPRQWNSRTSLRRWRELLAALNVPDPPTGPRTVHATRHTLITRLRAAKANPLAVRALTHPATLRGDPHDGYLHVELLHWDVICEAILSLDLTTEMPAAAEQLGFHWRSK